MEWQAVVLAVQIMLLAAGWLLFQRARGELSARAAETPVLAEVRALQKSVKQLVLEIESAADRQSARLEAGCSEAAAILLEMESKIRDAEERLARYEEAARRLEQSGLRPGEHEARSHNAFSRGAGVDGGQVSATRLQGAGEAQRAPATVAEPVQAVVSLRDTVFRLADGGETTPAIARAMKLSEGEVETLLSLRGRR